MSEAKPITKVPDGKSRFLTTRQMAPNEKGFVGYETVCHRLSTLQRKGRAGVPFSFVRVDRAGNVSKRQSATDFHFSRSGGTCPLWNVYEAFAHPGRINLDPSVVVIG